MPEKDELNDEISLLDYLIVLAKHKKLIIYFTLFVAAVTALYSFTLPKIYRAETRIISPGESGSKSLLLREVSSVIGIDNSSGGFNDPSSIIGIIKSRTVYDRIIERFGLIKLYNVKFMEDARRVLDNDIKVSSDKLSRIITVSVLNENPGLAADMANAFVEELKNLMQNLAITEASRRRLFFEEKLSQTKEALIKSEEEMREFQEKTGVLKVEEQAKAVIESIAELRAQLAAKEVEIMVMKTYSTANNPDLQMAQEALKGLKAELTKLEQKGGSDPDTLMPTGRMPLVGTDYVRKLRDLKFNESLYEIMAKQYEMARIDEAKDAAVIQVIDRAVPPEKKFKPARRQMVMIAAITAFFFSVFLAFIMEYYNNVSSGTENKGRLEALKRYLSFKKQ